MGSAHSLIICCSVLCSEDPEVNESAGEVGGFSTVDHADIRGSAFAAFMVTIRRELPRTGLAGWLPHNVIEGSPPLAGSTADSFTSGVLEGSGCG